MSKSKKKFYKRWWFILLVIIGVVAIAGSASNSKKSSSSEKIVSEESKNIKSSDTSTRDNSSAKLTKLSTGTFEVGNDILQGRYVCTGDSTGNFIVYDKSGMPTVNEILGKEDMGVSNVTINLKEGQKIDIKSIKNVTFTPAETKLSKDLSAGEWEVGLDIEPGKYIAKVEKGQGNFIVYSGDLPKVNEILDANGDLGVSNVTLELKKGDVIRISSLEKVSFSKN